MSDNTPEKQVRKSNAEAYETLDSISIATFDVDGRIFRTLWHTFLRPGDVAMASFTADFSQYISPVRVFVALFSMQFIIGATVDLPMIVNVDLMTTGYDPAVVEAWLGNLNRTEVNVGMERVMSLLTWPIMIIASLPYLVALKFLRWKLKFLAHLMVYMIATNASTVTMILLIPLYSFGQGFFALSMPAGLLVFVVIAAILMARYYAKTALGLTVRIGVIVLLVPVSLLITIAGMFGSGAYLLHRNYDLSIVELVEAQAEADANAATPATPETPAEPQTEPQTDETEPPDESP